MGLLCDMLILLASGVLSISAVIWARGSQCPIWVNRQDCMPTWVHREPETRREFSLRASDRTSFGEIASDDVIM